MNGTAHPLGWRRRPIAMGGTTVTTMGFGIGCFSFEALGVDFSSFENPEGTYSAEQWALDVESALASIPNVDNIEVKGFRAFRLQRGTNWRNQIEAQLSKDPNPKFHRGGLFEPHPITGRIAFTLNIPEHIQRSVAPFGRSMKGTNFSVEIRYSYDMPVAFVTGPPSKRPTDAVPIVREFLAKEFQERLGTNSPITFSCMGPSPMWNDCFLTAVPAPLGQPLTYKVSPSPGYKRVDFEFNVGPGDLEVPSMAEAWELLKDVLEDQVSAFYGLVSEKNLMMLRRSYVESQLEELVLAYKSHGLRDWISRLRRSGTTATELSLDVIAGRGRQNVINQQARENLRSIREAALFVAFEHEFERLFEDGASDDSIEVEQIITLLADRHSRDVQLVSLVISSVLGGLVGAGITALVTVLLGTPAA